MLSGGISKESCPLFTIIYAPEGIFSLGSINAASSPDIAFFSRTVTVTQEFSSPDISRFTCSLSPSCTLRAFSPSKSIYTLLFTLSTKEKLDIIVSNFCLSGLTTNLYLFAHEGAFCEGGIYARIEFFKSLYLHGI